MDEKASDPNLIFIDHVKLLIKRVEPVTKSRNGKTRVQAIDVYMRLLEFAYAIDGNSESSHGRHPLARRVRIPENRI